MSNASGEQMGVAMYLGPERKTGRKAGATLAVVAAVVLAACSHEPGDTVASQSPTQTSASETGPASPSARATGPDLEKPACDFDADGNPGQIVEGEAFGVLAGIAETTDARFIGRPVVLRDGTLHEANVTDQLGVLNVGPALSVTALHVRGMADQRFSGCELAIDQQNQLPGGLLAGRVQVATGEVTQFAVDSPFQETVPSFAPPSDSDVLGELDRRQTPEDVLAKLGGFSVELGGVPEGYVPIQVSAG